MKKGRYAWIWLLLVAAVIANELRKPAEERTWNDRLFGVLPYDFRPPTWERVKQTVWDPQNDHILVPHAFGIGWSINLAPILRRAGLAGE